MLLEALILTVLFYLVVGNKILSSGNPWMCRNKIWTFTAPPISSNTTFKIESKITLLSLLIVKGKSQMNRETEVSEDPISLGHEQTVTVTALDTVTDEQIQSAAIDGIVIYPSGETKIFDDDEKSFHLLGKLVQIEPNIFSIDITASAMGYEEVSKS